MALFKPGALVVYRMQKSSVYPGSRGYNRNRASITVFVAAVV